MRINIAEWSAMDVMEWNSLDRNQRALHNNITIFEEGVVRDPQMNTTYIVVHA